MAHMIQKWRSIFEKLKERGASVRAWIAGALLALGLWGIAFPRYLFTDDCVKVFSADGREAVSTQREEKNLYREIGTAAPEQIEIKISILEWAKR